MFNSSIAQATFSPPNLPRESYRWRLLEITFTGLPKAHADVPRDAGPLQYEKGTVFAVTHGNCFSNGTIVFLAAVHFSSALKAWIGFQHFGI